MKRVLLITNIPTPYRIPLFNELNKQLEEAGFAFKVLFSARTYDRRKWNIDLNDCQFDHVVLDSSSIERGHNVEGTTFTYKGLYRVIHGFAPAVIIVPGFSIATVKVWLLSWRRKTKYLIWSGSVKHAGRLDSTWRMMQRKMLASRAAGGITYGRKAKAYLKALGMPEQNLYLAINTVDVCFFRQATAALRQQQDRCAKKFLTYIGYLSPRKNVRRLLDVIVLLVKERDDFVLDVVGDGEERRSLQAYVHTRNLSEFVVFHGYKQKEEVVTYLARSSGLLFQTDFDIWGLVLNEAMAAAVPCIASVHAGATHDLIEDGKTGFAVDFSETTVVAERINWLLDHPEEAAEMGRRARRYVAEHASLQQSAAAFVEAAIESCRHDA